MRPKKWVVYLIRCSDESVYCGITNNIENRIAVHNSGKGAKYTRSRRPVELVAASPEMTKNDALKMEYRIKRISVDKKIIELKKGKVKTTMNLKKELQNVSAKIKALLKTVDKLTAAAEKSEKPAIKAARKKPATKAMVKKSPAGKPVVQKSIAQKTPAKKPAPKKSVVKKKDIENPVMEKPSKGTAVDTVLGLIKESGNGINTAALMEKTGFNEKKIQNLIFKLKKQGKIKSVSKGLYEGA
jgi:putative endonuclease